MALTHLCRSRGRHGTRVLLQLQRCRKEAETRSVTEIGSSELAIAGYYFFLIHLPRTNFWSKRQLRTARLPTQKSVIWFVCASEWATLLIYQLLLLLTVILLGNWGWWILYL